jgi:hypothetical protein
MAEIDAAMSASSSTGGGLALDLKRIDDGMSKERQEARQTAALAGHSFVAINALSGGALSGGVSAPSQARHVGASPAVAPRAAEPARMRTPQPDQIRRMRQTIPIVDGAAARALVELADGDGE